MSKRIKKQWEIVKKQKQRAHKFFNQDEIEDAIQNIWAIFENCINIIKDIKNHTPLKSHKDKTSWFRKYSREGILLQDYSNFHKEIDNYRIRAFLGEYSYKKPIPPKASIKPYLDKTDSLFKETEKIIEPILNPKNKKDV